MPPFEVLVWDYDAADDAPSCYFVAKRRRFHDLQQAIYYADECADFDRNGIYVSAAVFRDGERLYVVGEIGFDYVPLKTA